MGRTTAFLRAGTALTGFVLAMPAVAQTAATPNGGTDSGEIVVTAQRRAERLIETPLSISIVSAEKLASTGATQFRDFADAVPGLSFQTSGPGYTQISLRGISAGSDAGATVAIYVDDIPIGSSTTYARGGQTTFDSSLFDLERVEVLRGPQGTLYGASSMGGVLKYVTGTPDTGRFSGKIMTGAAVTAHGDPSYNVAGLVNAPIAADKAAVRVSAFYTRTGGYIDNPPLDQKDINSSEIYGGRADILLTPTEKMDIRLTGFVQNISNDGFPFADYMLSGAPVRGPLDANRPVDEPFESKLRLAAGTINYDLDFAKLTSITSYQTNRTHFLLYSASTTNALRPSGAGSVTVIDDTSTKKFTQEVRIASETGKPVEWLVGGYYTREKSYFNQDLMVLTPTGETLPNTFLTLSIPSRYREYALFGDLTVHLGKAFDVTAGIRYAWNRTTFEQIGSGSFTRSAPRTSSSDKVATYLLNARYRLTDRATAYVRYATGYRPGGPNIVTIDPATGAVIGQPTFDSDRLESYEAGLKYETADRSFGLDLAAFYIDWDNIIVNFTQNGFAARTNVPGGATSRGGELTLTARPTRGFVATAALAYQRARLSEASTVLRAAKGERLPGVPRVTASVNADYEWDTGTIRPSLGASLRFVGDRRSSYNAATSVPQYRLPSYEAVDLRAGLSFGRVKAQVYARNLFDAKGQLNTRFTSPAAGPITLSILQPRTIGASVAMDF